MKTAWETILSSIENKTETSRLRVPGGWLVKQKEGARIALAFVPDLSHIWQWE